MDTLKILQLDILGTNPLNKIEGEEMPIQDGCPWVIPNGSPFFGDYPVNGQLPLTIVYNEAGAELKRDKDYWLEEEFAPLVEVTGRPVVCFIRLSDEIITSNTKIKATYRSVGAYFVPRNSLRDWLDVIHSGVTPIPWEKIFGVPPTLPAEFHSHSIKTEIRDWFEYTWFFTYVTNILKGKDTSVAPDIEAAARQAFDQLYAYRDQQWNRLNAHDRNYNRPHGITVNDVNMGNHPNYGTANLAQHRQGLRSDLLATPQGVQTLITESAPDVSGSMRSGVLPLSKYSNGTYIPPSITGSFEGLGSLSECMGICVEVDGRCVVIQNHFDGRNEGLYFSTLIGFDRAYTPTNPYKFEYTNYKYEPPMLTNIGITPNQIIGGSGNDVIMVGKTTKGNPAANDRWFVSLTNNSFDPGGHRFIEVNMAAVFAQCGAPDANGMWGPFTYHGRMTVHLLGEWVYLVVDSAATGNLGNQGRMSYWRISRQNIINGVNSAWQLVRLTYQDADNIQYTNANYWEYAQKVLNGGNVSRWGRFTFSPLQPPAYVGYMGRRAITLFAKKPGTTNVFYLNWIMYTFLEHYPVGGTPVNAATITNMVYEFNVDTGVMTMVYKQNPITLDYQSGQAYNTAIGERAKWMHWYGPTVQYLVPATIILSSGEQLSSITGPGQEASVLNSVIRYTKYTYLVGSATVTSKADLLKGSLGTDRVVPTYQWSLARNIQTPIPVGISSRWMAYETTGENFMTYPLDIVDQAVGLQNPQIVCRNVSGAYAVRPEVYNQTLSPLYSRPLTNAVYKTNMTYSEGVITVTGSEAELAARGVEAGAMALSSCGWSAKSDNDTVLAREFPSAAFRAPNETGVFISFPKTYTRTLDPASQVMKYIPTAFYGIGQAVKDKIRSLIPAAQQGEYWCFALHVLNEESGPMFGGINKAALIVKYANTLDGNNGYWDGQVFWVTPVVEAPNANHPGCHLITDLQIISNTQQVRMVSGANPNAKGAQTYAHTRSFASFYRDGNTLKAFMTSGFGHITGSFQQEFSAMDVNIATGVISNFGVSMSGWNEADKAVNLPKIGRTRMGLANLGTFDATITNAPGAAITSETSGGAARIWPVDKSGGGVDYYATITPYPQTGWGIFFLEEVEIMINGVMYLMPLGTVDLRDIDPSPTNKTFWIYATVEDQAGKYFISSTKLRKSNSFIHAATVITGANQILLIERHQPFMISNLELSYTRKGGSIPVSAGFPQEEGNFTILRASELLP